MKNKLAFICLLFLAFCSVSSAFAQDSTSIKITLPDSEKWSIDSVKIYNFLHDKWTYFDKIDTAINSCFIKFPCKRAIEQNVYLGNNKGFYLLTLPDDNVEIVIDEKGEHNFIKGKSHRENQILHDNDWIWKFFFTDVNIHSSREYGFFRIDSIRNEILNEYQIATQNFVVNPIFDTYLRNELTALQIQMFDTDNNNKKINNKYLFTKEYYKYRPIIKDSLESYYPYGSNYFSFLYNKVKNEDCKEDKYERLNNKHYYCAYQKIKTIKDNHLRKHLLMNIFAELAYSVDWWKDEQEERNYEEVLEEMKKNYPNNERVKSIEERAVRSKRLSEILPVTNFTLKDKNNKKVSLSDFRGKYVFIAFIDSAVKNLESHAWYSKHLYKEHTDEKIAFLYIFINDSETAWRNIISTQKTDGIHLFANPEQSKELYEYYNLRSYQLGHFTMNGLDTSNDHVAFINKDGYFIHYSLYLGHNMRWVADKISKGE